VAGGARRDPRKLCSNSEVLNHAEVASKQLDIGGPPDKRQLSVSIFEAGDDTNEPLIRVAVAVGPSCRRTVSWKCDLGIPQLARGPRENFGELHCKLGHAVQIEPGLRPQSPKNGNFPSVRRRLSAILLWECPKSESGDWPQICKSPPLAGLSASIRGSFSDRRTGWLTWEDSNFHITVSKNAFEMSTEFPLFWPKIRLGDFCSCELWR
jgi:hypothetical protein